jgi:hypothetical protein
MDLVVLGFVFDIGHGSWLSRTACQKFLFARNLLIYCVVSLIGARGAIPARRSGLCVAGGRQKTWRPFSPVVELHAVTRSAGAVCKVTLQYVLRFWQDPHYDRGSSPIVHRSLGVRNMGVLRSFYRSLGWRELPIGDEVPGCRGGSTPRCSDLARGNRGPGIGSTLTRPRRILISSPVR